MSTEYLGRTTAVNGSPQRWYSTAAMARYMGRSPDWLRQRIGTVFAEGVHYHHKPDCRDPFWDRLAIDEWITGTGDPAADEILQKMVS